MDVKLLELNSPFGQPLRGIKLLHNLPQRLFNQHSDGMSLKARQLLHLEFDPTNVAHPSNQSLTQTNHEIFILAN